MTSISDAPPKQIVAKEEGAAVPRGKEYSQKMNNNSITLIRKK
jgi:hypothetical protein